jgi:hypothetical protein
VSLICQVTLNVNTYAAGQNPPPQATLIVFNPNATAVVVTSVQMRARTLNDNLINRTSMPPSVPPIGPGMTTSVPAGSSINIGPFPVVEASAANNNSFQAVNQTGNLNPINPQGTQRPQHTLMIGADVYGSDGSFNQAGEAGLLVSYGSTPPPGYQGGYLNFAGPNNFIGVTPGWP